jgi:hypothetical protein
LVGWDQQGEERGEGTAPEKSVVILAAVKGRVENVVGGFDCKLTEADDN